MPRQGACQRFAGENRPHVSDLRIVGLQRQVHLDRLPRGFEIAVRPAHACESAPRPRIARRSGERSTKIGSSVGEEAARNQGRKNLRQRRR